MASAASIETRTGLGTAVMPVLIELGQVEAYQCSRCKMIVEVPKRAVLCGTLQAVKIQSNPLNHLLWLEEQQAKHRDCQEHIRTWFHEIRVWRSA